MRALEEVTPEARQRTRPPHRQLHPRDAPQGPQGCRKRRPHPTQRRQRQSPETRKARNTPALSRPSTQAHSHGPRDRRPLRSPLRPGLHCGLREGELLGLKWDDIDTSGATATLHVKRTLSQTRTGHIFEKPKNGKGRSIKCSQKATQALGRHRSRQNQERRAAGPLWQDNDLAFPTLTGTTTSGTNLLSRHFKPPCKEQSYHPSGSMISATPALQYSSWQASTRSTSRNS